MSVALYMDENVNEAITVGLRLRGVDVLTAQEDGMREKPDAEVLDRATSLGRVAVSEVLISSRKPPAGNGAAKSLAG